MNQILCTKCYRKKKIWFFYVCYAAARASQIGVCTSLCSSNMCLHPLRVSLGIVRGWRWVGETSGASVLRQSHLRTLLAWPRPLSCWIHLIGWPFFYGWSKAHSVARVLGGVSIVIVGQLGCAVQQAAISGVISRGLQSWIGNCFLALCRPGEGVELGISCMGHPGRGSGVIAARPGAWYCTGGNSTAGSSRGPAGGCAGGSAVWIGWTELSLVVDGPGLVVGSGSHVVVAVGWILRLKGIMLIYSALIFELEVVEPILRGTVILEMMHWNCGRQWVNNLSLMSVCVVFFHYS